MTLMVSRKLSQVNRNQDANQRGHLESNPSLEGHSLRGVLKLIMVNIQLIVPMLMIGLTITTNIGPMMEWQYCFQQGMMVMGPVR